VAETVQHYITAMDTLKIGMLAVDQVHPPLTVLFSALNSVPLLAPDFEGKAKVKEWLTTLNRMSASEELGGPGEAAQL